LLCVIGPQENIVYTACCTCLFEKYIKRSCSALVHVFSMHQQSLQLCTSGSETAEVQVKADSDCQTTELESVDNGLAKRTAKDAMSTKSKAEMRAKRRALQVS